MNAVFTPDEAELARARRIVDAFDRAESTDMAAVKVDGRIVDDPVASKAPRLLALARPKAQ